MSAQWQDSFPFVTRTSDRQPRSGEALRSRIAASTPKQNECRPHAQAPSTLTQLQGHGDGIAGSSAKHFLCPVDRACLLGFTGACSMPIGTSCKSGWAWQRKVWYAGTCPSQGSCVPTWCLICSSTMESLCIEHRFEMVVVTLLP
jgi:hypothetical protein